MMYYVLCHMYALFLRFIHPQFSHRITFSILYSHECIFDRKLDVCGNGRVKTYFAVIQKTMVPTRGDPLLIHTLCQQVQDSSPLRILSSPYHCAQTTFLAE